MTKKYLTTIELANYLSLHPVTIREWVCSRKIPFYKIGKAVRFNIDEIELWLKKKYKKQIN